MLRVLLLLLFTLNVSVNALDHTVTYNGNGNWTLQYQEEILGNTYTASASVFWNGSSCTYSMHYERTLPNYIQAIQNHTVPDTFKDAVDTWLGAGFESSVAGKLAGMVKGLCFINGFNEDADPNNDIPPPPDNLDPDWDFWDGNGDPPWVDDGSGNEDDHNDQEDQNDDHDPLGEDELLDGEGDGGGTSGCTPPSYLGKVLPRPVLPSSSYSQLETDLQDRLIVDGLSGTTGVYFVVRNRSLTCDTATIIHALDQGSVTYKGQSAKQYQLTQWRYKKDADTIVWQLVDKRRRTYIGYLGSSNIIPKDDSVEAPQDDDPANDAPQGDTTDLSGVEAELEQMNENIVNGNNDIGNRLRDIININDDIRQDQRKNHDEQMAQMEDIETVNREGYRELADLLDKIRENTELTEENTEDEEPTNIRSDDDFSLGESQETAIDDAASQFGNKFGTYDTYAENPQTFTFNIPVDLPQGTVNYEFGTGNIPTGLQTWFGLFAVFIKSIISIYLIIYFTGKVQTLVIPR